MPKKGNIMNHKFSILAVFTLIIATLACNALGSPSNNPNDVPNPTIIQPQEENTNSDNTSSTETVIDSANPMDLLIKSIDYKDLGNGYKGLTIKVYSKNNTESWLRFKILDNKGTDMVVCQELCKS